jgi:hypothetical protein
MVQKIGIQASVQNKKKKKRILLPEVSHAYISKPDEIDPWNSDFFQQFAEIGKKNAFNEKKNM